MFIGYSNLGYWSCGVFGAGSFGTDVSRLRGSEDEIEV